MELARFKSTLSERQIGVEYDEKQEEIRVAYLPTHLVSFPRYVTLSPEDVDDLITALQYARHLQEQGTND